MGGVHFTVTQQGAPLNIQQLQTEGGEWCIAVNQGMLTSAKYALATLATFYSIAHAAPVLIATALAGLFVPQLGQQIKEQFDKIFETSSHEHNGEPCQQSKALQLALMVAAGYMMPVLGAACTGHWLSEQASAGINSVSEVIDGQVENITSTPPQGQVDGSSANNVE